MAADDETREPDVTVRNRAVEQARVALAQAARELKHAVEHAGNVDDTGAHLQLLREETVDVYTRVGALGLRLTDLAASAE